MEQLRIARGEVDGVRDNCVMGIKEGPWGDEHRVSYAPDEPLNSTSETNKAQ